MKVTVADRIHDLLKKNQQVAYTPLGVAIALQLNHNTVRRTIRQMDLDGEVARLGGRYTFPLPTVAEVNANA